MDNFAPGLRESIVALSSGLRFVVFFLCVAGVMMQVHQSRGDSDAISRILVRAVVVTAMVAMLPYWFQFAEEAFLALANGVCDGYSEKPMQAAAKLRATMSEKGTDFSLSRVGESMYQAFLWGSAKLVVLIGSLLQLPFHALQYVLKLLCYLFLPVALGTLMLPSQASLGARYIQQTIAILSWPVGFAVTELVAYHLLTAYANNLAVAYDINPGEINAASYASLVGGVLAALWIVIGTIGTPILMQKLICGGTPLSGGGQSAMQELYLVQQIVHMVKTLKTAGLATAAAAAGGAAKSGGNPPAPPLPPPSAPMTSPPAPTAPSSSDARASSAIASVQLPTPQTTI